MTCQFCGVEAGQEHDHWRHLIMGRMAALEGFVCKAGGQVDKLAESESERVWAEIRAMADRVAKLEAAGQLASAGEATAPPGWKLAITWHQIDDVDATCDKCDPEEKAAFERTDGSLSCTAHAVEMGALVRDEQPAEQPVPAAGTLSERIRETGWGRLADEVVTLEAKLAQAERDVRHWQDDAADRLNEAAQAKRERDERGRQVEKMAEHVAKMRVERDEARDCGQEGEVCKVPPGCQHHWELRARELLRERNEATARERERCLATAVYHGAIETASGIRSGAPAPKCDPDQPREDREGRTHRHRLKVWPPFFDDIIAGRKSFEIRKNDRDFKVGDEWVAEEYRPGYGFTGVQSSPFTITYVTPPSDCIPAGYCGFQFEKSRRIETEPTPSVAPDRTQSK